MSSNSFAQGLKRAKPYVAVVLLQFGYAGSSIITKFALNQGMSQHVLVVYRHIVATAIMAPFALVLERKTRPKMTYSIFTKILLLSLVEPVIDQNLFYTGMKLTTATFTAAMTNVLPAFVFILACIFGLEKVNLGRIRSQAKVLGTVVTVGGAMVMSMFNGPMLNLPWANQSNHLNTDNSNNNNNNSQITVKGSLMIAAGCVCWSIFIILQAITLKAYPAALSLTVLICVMGAAGGSVLALALEWGNPAAWAIHANFTLIASLYNGIVTSGIAYYIQGMVVKDKGPVFVTAFTPLVMVIVAVLSSFILAEIMYLGRVIGAIIIAIGLYMVLWSKSKDMTLSESNKVVSLATNQNTTSNISNTEINVNDGTYHGRTALGSVL